MLAPIVEGLGDVEALPIILRKILHQKEIYDIEILRPLNCHGKGNLTRNNGIERFVQLAAGKPNCSAILVLCDSDNDCPVELGKHFSERIKSLKAPKPVAIAIACREFETWFLADIENFIGKPLNGRPGISRTTKLSVKCESIASAKGWISQHLPADRNYKETTDQAAMSGCLDISNTYKNSRSFRRLNKALDELLSSIHSNTATITP